MTNNVQQLSRIAEIFQTETTLERLTEMVEEGLAGDGLEVLGIINHINTTPELLSSLWRKMEAPYSTVLIEKIAVNPKTPSSVIEDMWVSTAPGKQRNAARRLILAHPNIPVYLKVKGLHSATISSWYDEHKKNEIRGNPHEWKQQLLSYLYPLYPDMNEEIPVEWLELLAEQENDGKWD